MSIEMKVEEKEILIGTIGDHQYFLGPEHDGEMSWHDAKRWCNSLGEDYELPNRLVMLAVCMNKETAALLTENSIYWTSSEFEDDAFFAWTQELNSSAPGCQDCYGKMNSHWVRAVRKVKV